MRVAVIGAGSWGTTVAAVAAKNTSTVLWARRPELADQINTRHVNADYLSGFTLPDELRATADIEEAVRDADVLVMGVPSVLNLKGNKRQQATAASDPSSLQFITPSTGK